jgi:type IX secretion system PorP/SprF family membrane protein
MKKQLLTALLSLAFVSAWSQSEPMFTFNLFNRLNFNPAVAGSEEVLDAGVIYRNQWWSGLEGAPRTANMYAHMPVMKRSAGLGMNMIYDKIGTDKLFSFALDYAYRIRFSGKNVLAIGLSATVENVRTDWNEINGAVNLNDVSLGNDIGSRTRLNLGPGIYFKNKKFYAGLSVPRVLANSLYNDRGQFSNKVNTWFFQTGMTLPLDKGGSLKLLPNIQVRHNSSSPFSMTANLNLLIHNALMLGVAHHWDDSVDGLLSYQFANGLRMGLAIDFTVSDLRNATTGSFEVMMAYTFPCDDCRIKNLRYF